MHKIRRSSLYLNYAGGPEFLPANQKATKKISLHIMKTCRVIISHVKFKTARLQPRKLFHKKAFIVFHPNFRPSQICNNNRQKLRDIVVVVGNLRHVHKL